MGRTNVTPGCCILAEGPRQASALHRPLSSHCQYMQLRLARLCLDCEEIHEAQQCPVCASETFAFLARWVPAPERRAKPRPTQPPPPAPSRLPSRGKVVGFGVMGLGILGVVQWLAKGRTLIERAAENQHSGELK